MTGKLCDYGCGQPAKYKFKNGKYCCIDKSYKCRNIILDRKYTGINNKIKNKWSEDEARYYLVNSLVKILKPFCKHKYCDYGCGQLAKYELKNGKWCCVEEWRLCPYISETKRRKMKDVWKDPNSKLNSNECRKNLSKGVKKSWDNSPNRRKKLSKWNKENWEDSNSFFYSEIRTKKISEKSKNFWSDLNNKDKMKEKLKISNKLSLKQIRLRYPIFSKVEELRYNPDKPGQRVIQGHCKNHNCINSKEKGGWFDLGKWQLSDRIRAIESDSGSDACYFYCCDECKEECPLYNKRVSQLINEDKIKAGIIKEEYYTQEEYNIWRHEVLKRAEYKCEYCEEAAEHCHHIIPQKTNIFFSLDPDYGVACCEKCHYKYGHKDECSTGQLAQKVCI